MHPRLAARTLSCWILLGLALTLIADRRRPPPSRGPRRAAAEQPAAQARLV
ncbi:hypothetical protein [Streptomyces sp. ALI-76-A]|uniref:hypothetical protein n=1 Tax=Streptomyces sp. ALI-76-A TaxID=3025736 RepID=UPI00256EAE64|nr:hypothetical protein [Streptomyces sp. ALI-76-A]MDL5205980.1 hypothetical protein [Streptomyces sp. ALI-76-A]